MLKNAVIMRIGHISQVWFTTGAKNLSHNELLVLIEHAPFELQEGETCNGKILHAPAGAVFARERFGIEDDEILSAIRWHTLGRVGMTDLEKIIFLADKIDPKPAVVKLTKNVLNSLIRLTDWKKKS